MYKRFSKVLKSEDGAIDLASIMVGVIVIGLIGGVIAATIFAVIPWAQDNAAKQQIDNVSAAQSAYVGLHTDTGTGEYQYGDLTDENSSIAQAHLMTPNQARYCSQSYNWSGEKGYVTYAMSDSGKIFWAQNGGPATVAPMPRQATCLVRPAEQLWNIEDAGLRYQVRTLLGIGGGDDLLLTDAQRLDNTLGAQLDFSGVRTAAGLEKATNLTSLGSVTLTSFEDSRGLENIQHFDNLYDQFSAITELSLPSLKEVPGTIRVISSHITKMTAPNLATVGRIEAFNSPNLSTVEFPALTSADSLRFDASAAIRINLSALQTVTGNIEFASGKYTELDLSALQTVTGTLSFGAGYSADYDLSSVIIPNLTTVGSLRSYTEDRVFASFNANLVVSGETFIYVNSLTGNKVYNSIASYLAG